MCVTSWTGCFIPVYWLLEHLESRNSPELVWYKAKPLRAQLLTRPSFNTSSQTWLVPLCFCLIYIQGKRLLLNYLKQPACLFTWLKRNFAGKPTWQLCVPPCVRSHSGDGVWMADLGLWKAQCPWSAPRPPPHPPPPDTHSSLSLLSAQSLSRSQIFIRPHLIFIFVSHLSPLH